MLLVIINYFMVFVESYFRSYRTRIRKFGRFARLQHQSTYLWCILVSAVWGGLFVFVAPVSVLNVRPAPFSQPCSERTGSKRFVRADDAVRPTDKRCPKRMKNASPRPTARKIQLRHSSVTPFDGRRFVSRRFRRNNFVTPIPKLRHLNLVKLSSKKTIATKICRRQ